MVRIGTSPGLRVLFPSLCPSAHDGAVGSLWEQHPLFSALLPSPNMKTLVLFCMLVSCALAADIVVFGDSWGAPVSKLRFISCVIFNAIAAHHGVCDSIMALFVTGKGLVPLKA